MWFFEIFKTFFSSWFLYSDEMINYDTFWEIYIIYSFMIIRTFIGFGH